MFTLYIGYIFVAAHISIRHRVNRHALKRHEQIRPVGSHFLRYSVRSGAKAAMIMSISRATDVCRLKHVFRGVYRDFQIRNDPIACLHYIFLEVESVKVYHFQDRGRSVEEVPWHQKRAKGNLSCLNKTPVYGIRYPVWFLRRDENNFRYIMHWYQ